MSRVVKESPPLRSLGVVGRTELIPVATYLDKMLLGHALKLNASKNPQHTYVQSTLSENVDHTSITIIIIIITYYPSLQNSREIGS